MNDVIENARLIMDYVEVNGNDASHILDDGFKPYGWYIERMNKHNVANELHMTLAEMEEAFEYINSVTEGNVESYGDFADIFIK